MTGEREQKRILIFTGEGKGKTTAAIGMSARASGRGMKVCFIEFVKDRGMQTGEAAFMEKSESIDYIRSGLGRVPPPGSPGFRRHREAAREGLDAARRAVLCREYDLVVLDEIFVAIHLELLEAEDICELLKPVSALPDMVLTGRYATAGLLNMADTVTEMRCVKHAFDTGTAARKGIEL